MKYIYFFVLASIAYTSNAQCDNRMLNLVDSHPDYVDFTNSPYSVNGDFTLELWFYSDATSNNAICDKKTLLDIYSSGSSLSIYDCNGDLYIDITGAGCSDSQLLLSSVRYSWHHLSISRSGNNTSVSISCNNLVYNSSLCSSYDISGSIRLGSDSSGSIPNSWSGHVDELRLWSSVRSATEICDYKNCTVEAVHPDLIALYPMDQGVAGDPAFPANDNSTITTLDDITAGAQHGTLQNFTLIGQTSNFICSNSPMIYPLETNLIISDYATQSTIVNQICSGDPVHFCLLDNNNQVPASNPFVTLTWEYDNGSGWQTLSSPSFGNNFCFGVGVNELLIDCLTNSVGYEDWLIRAKFQISNATSDQCEYYSSAVALTLCCDINPVSINVSSNFPSNLFCEGDLVNYSVNLQTAYPFLQTPAVDVTIDWFYCENATVTPITVAQNNSSFVYNNVPAVATTVCFKADISSCSLAKSESIQTCIDIDKEPMCGTISAIPDVGPLTTISNPPAVYEICPGDAAIVQIDGGFLDCIPNWEYSFDPSFSLSFPIGSTNTAINTNSLPGPTWPPTATSIFYRVVCQPLSSPSGCDPCYSNIVEIKLKSALSPPQIIGPNTVCEGGSTSWSVANPIAGVNYTWLCEGIVAGTGSTINPPVNTCCTVLADDGCSQEESSTQCLTECIIEGSISCPKAPNQCPKVGDIINLCICDAVSNCGSSLNYNWAWNNGTLVSQSGCDLFHIPSAAGTTYSVTVTDLTSNCTAVFTKDFTPCI